MAQCAVTQYTVCFVANGSLFLPVTELFQQITGNIFINTAGASGGQVSNTPLPGMLTPGQSYTMFAGDITVQAGGLQFDFDGGLPGTVAAEHSIQVCATDDDGQTCCSIKLVFNDDPNCAVSGGDCLDLTVNDGDTITPDMVFSGAISFGDPVIAGKTGTNEVGSPTSTSVTVECTGASDGTISLRMADGSICVVDVLCAPTGGSCLDLTVNDGDTISPGMVVSGATSFGSPVIAGKTGVEEMSSPTSTSVTVSCTGTSDGTIILRMSDGSTCLVNVNCGTVQPTDLVCVGTGITVAAGGTYPVSSLASGGTTPYSISNFVSSSSLITATTSSIIVAAGASGGYSADYTITDSAGGTVACNISINVPTVGGCNHTGATVVITPQDGSAVDDATPGSLGIAEVTGCDGADITWQSATPFTEVAGSNGTQVAFTYPTTENTSVQFSVECCCDA